METLMLNVNGMTCMGCVNSIKRVLEPLPGVSSVDVSLENGRVNIVYDAAESQPPQFKAVIEDAGFEVA